MPPPDKPQQALYSIEAEQAVLGALMFSADLWPVISERLRPQHFFDPVHGLIYETIGGLVGAGKSAGPTILFAALQSSQGANEIELRRYLESVAAAVPSIVSAKDYADVVFEKAIARGLVSVGETIAARARSAGLGDPPDAQIADAERNLRALADAGAPTKAAFIGHNAQEWLDAAKDAKGGITGVTTGLSALDDASGGMKPEELFILAGRPSMGKSLCALGIAKGALIAGSGVHISSMEMSRKALWARLLSDLARDKAHIPYSQIGRRPLFPNEIDALWLANDVIRSMPLVVDDAGGRTVEQVASAARASRRKLEARGFPLGLVVVDYLQLMARDRAYGDNASVAIGQQSKAMKALAKELQCSVLLLSQLNRAVEGRDDKRPTMADLRQSGEIEEDADMIGLLLRPEYYVMRDENSTDEERAAARGILKIFLDKNRNGPITMMEFGCDVATNSIWDLERYHDRSA